MLNVFSRWLITATPRHSTYSTTSSPFISYYCCCYPSRIISYSRVLYSRMNSAQTTLFEWLVFPFGRLQIKIWYLGSFSDWTLCCIQVVWKVWSLMTNKIPYYQFLCFYTQLLLANSFYFIFYYMISYSPIDLIKFNCMGFV